MGREERTGKLDFHLTQVGSTMVIVLVPRRAKLLLSLGHDLLLLLFIRLLRTQEVHLRIHSLVQTEMRNGSKGERCKVRVEGAAAAEGGRTTREEFDRSGSMEDRMGMEVDREDAEDLVWKRKGFFCICLLRDEVEVDRVGRKKRRCLRKASLETPALGNEDLRLLSWTSKDNLDLLLRLKTTTVEEKTSGMKMICVDIQTGGFRRLRLGSGLRERERRTKDRERWRVDWMRDESVGVSKSRREQVVLIWRDQNGIPDWEGGKVREEEREREGGRRRRKQGSARLQHIQ